MIAVTINLPPLAKYQQDFIFCDEPLSIIEGCTKSGKTIGCVWWLFTQAANSQRSGREFWWVARVVVQAKIAFRRFTSLLRESDPKRVLGWTVNLSEPSITLRNGSVIRFKSADKPDSLYGEDVDAAVIDEASRCKADAYYAIESTLTATGGKLRIMGNMRGRKNWAYQLARRAQTGALSGAKFASITADDAVREGVITQAAVDRARDRLPTHVFRELYYNEPTEDGSNPFGMDHIRACIQDGLAPGPAIAFGVDLARKHDWTVIVGVNAQRRVCFYDRFQKMPWGSITKRIIEAVGDSPALIDSTGVGDAPFESIAAECPAAEPFTFTTKSKQALMERMSVAIQSHQAGILAGDMEKEFEAFEYEVHRTHTIYAAPSGTHDDCVCARALAELKCGTASDFSIKVVVGGRKGEKTAEDVEDAERDRKERWTGADKARADRELAFFSGGAL